MRSRIRPAVDVVAQVAAVVGPIEGLLDGVARRVEERGPERRPELGIGCAVGEERAEHVRRHALEGGDEDLQALVEVAQRAAGVGRLGAAEAPGEGCEHQSLPVGPAAVDGRFRRPRSARDVLQRQAAVAHLVEQLEGGPADRRVDLRRCAGGRPARGALGDRRRDSPFPSYRAGRRSSPYAPSTRVVATVSRRGHGGGHGGSGRSRSLRATRIVPRMAAATTQQCGAEAVGGRHSQRLAAFARRAGVRDEHQGSEPDGRADARRRSRRCPRRFPARLARRRSPRRRTWP